MGKPEYSSHEQSLDPSRNYSPCNYIEDVYHRRPKTTIVLVVCSFLPLLFLLLLLRKSEHKGATKPTLVSGYWRAAKADIQAPAAIDYTHLAQLNYAFYTPDLDENLLPDSSNGSALLSDVVSYAHDNGTQVVLSIGGASGSSNFTSCFASKASTKQLVAQCVSLIKQFDLDGIDLDYESPTNLNETTNAIDFLKSLRKALNKLKNKRTSTGHPLLTSILSATTFVDNSGLMLADLTSIANEVDSFNMGSYDYYSGTNTTAPNSPIFALECDELPVLRTACINDDVTAYLNAGVPPEKLRVGVPFYAAQAVVAAAPFEGMHCYPTISGGDSKIDIVYADAVVSQQGEDWSYGWDDTTRTGWAYNNSSKVFSATNWERAVREKAEYVSCKGLGGVNIWSVDDDLNGALTAVAAGVKEILIPRHAKIQVSLEKCKGHGLT